MCDFAVKPTRPGAYSVKEEEEDSSYPSREVRSTPITAATNKVPPTSTLVMAVLAPSTTASKNLCTPREPPFRLQRAVRDPRFAPTGRVPAQTPSTSKSQPRT